MKKRLITFFQKNTGWIISVFTSLAIVFTFILKLVKYVYSRIYFNYYGLNYNFFNVNELNFLYTFSFSIIYLILMFAIFYLFCEIIEIIHNRIWKAQYKKIIFDLFIILFLNILCAFPVYSKFIFSSFVVRLLCFIIIEFLVSFPSFRKESKQSTHVNSSIKDEIIYLIKILFVYLCFMFVSFFVLYGYELKNIKNYYVIEDNKVIVYSTNDYYIILNCEIIDDELIIYKGEQTKIDNNDVESKLIEFDKVTIK